MERSEESGITPTSNDNNALFVNLPGKETVTIRKLPDILELQQLKAKFELETGYHANTFSLVYGEIGLSEDLTLRFGVNVRNGGVLKLVLTPVFSELSDAMLSGNIPAVLQTCRGEAASPTAEDSVSVEDRTFFSLLLACRKGRLSIVQALVRADEESKWKHQCTQFGRTLCHVAAASDQTKVIYFLISVGAPSKVEDAFGQSPLDVANTHGAYTCERVLRQGLLLSKRLTGKTHPHQVANSAGRKVCWDDVPNPTPSRKPVAKPRKTTSARKDIANSTPGVSGTSLLSQRPKSSRGTTPNPLSPTSTTTKTITIPTASAQRGKENFSPHSQAPSPAPKTMHSRCASRPQFMAFRNVSPEEYRPMAVEVVPLETFTYDQRQVYQKKQAMESSASQPPPNVPCSSLNNSREDLRSAETRVDSDFSDVSDDELDEKQKILQKREELRRRYSRTRKMSLRAQSAKYFRSSFHRDPDDGVVPKPRPATAGTRYREWKTWLLEKMERDSEKKRQAERETERREQSAMAYRAWLSRKNRQEWERSSDEDSSEDEGDQGGRRKEYQPSAENEQAFQEWMDSKKEAFAKMAQTRKDVRSGKSAGHSAERKITVFELGNFGDRQLPTPDPDEYMRAYQSWKDLRTKYENWKTRKGIKDGPRKTLTKEDITRMRGALLLEGMTYAEWLGLKEREQAVAKLNVHNIGTEAGQINRSKH